jgi:UDP-N-acetylglucosamine--N-acetylmuramyl-(pentapeptide) pyrophosphoryl-undecaprenol N-acetylglucosamine transferase
MKLERVIISGGGTGGHIFPAIAIANEIRFQFPNCHILFVGANGRMEMEKVPNAGFQIKGLNIAGFNRKSPLKNILLPFKIINSLRTARKIITDFKPQLVIGVGGYASGPTLKAAIWQKIPTLIQEQNSFPGKTNLLLAKDAKAVCVAYTKMDRFFPSERLHLTGNPVRSDILDSPGKREEGIHYNGLNPNRKTVFIMGGSLGARTLNQSVLNFIDAIGNNTHLQVLWQCGRLHFESLQQLEIPSNVKLLSFIDRMDLAYAAADLIVSRAGATSISELSLVGKPTILVPSPNVTEDHQTKNAMALTNEEAAILISDASAPQELWPCIEKIIFDSEQCDALSKSIAAFAMPNATKDIVKLAVQIAETR